MHKNWNQRVDIKRDNRLYGVHFVNAEKYNPEIELWEILSGVIHMNVGEYGNRPRDKHVCRFETRLYHPYSTLNVDLRPIQIEVKAERILKSHDCRFISQDGTQLTVPIDWIRERIVDSWIEAMKLHGEPEGV